MDIRLRAEEVERRMLVSCAALSSSTRGRVVEEEECVVRTAYQRDRDRIIHSKSFRRLKHKTQVFISPEGDHYRTRLTHTLEVAQIARTVARALRLNEDLAEAIALGHDLGHTPFGHAGEAALNRLIEPGFRHNEQSLRVVDLLEGGQGLNLTWEVRDGILNHTGPVRPATLEGQIVKIADRVAYINHDIDDAIRGGVLTLAHLPGESVEILGSKHRERINNMVLDLIQTNYNESKMIRMSPPVQAATDQLRGFLFQHVYLGARARREETRAHHIIEHLFYKFQECPENLPGEYLERAKTDGTQRAACDYIAGMTDRFAIRTYQKHFLPVSWVE
ncbi:deoxyguanosinetriphosphate triphosphohydrolase [Pelotomaculum sp. PtaB.Bin117]|uniref:deoxyguanosinetriphosphate triphosphohydrolase n=1 Tax=Pelotomaculum sp. PtaB.Bin117 TaxID=1811694 RepID=UPI0009C66231|nr:deoxyguanosinetriphosphate triphosphohydrolase [Pelotomaculum sp. PtaB.Bin117]OPX87089.1 MAG: Deoxyguanosinetriphosphate triphosphohydrolase [Pelotomaculum sp. PtaB.Bin117]